MNVKDAAERSITLGFVIGFGNIGGIGIATPETLSVHTRKLLILSSIISSRCVPLPGE